MSYRVQSYTFNINVYTFDVKAFFDFCEFILYVIEMKELTTIDKPRKWARELENSLNITEASQRFGELPVEGMEVRELNAVLNYYQTGSTQRASRMSGIAERDCLKIINSKPGNKLLISIDLRCSWVRKIDKDVLQAYSLTMLNMAMGNLAMGVKKITKGGKEETELDYRIDLKTAVRIIEQLAKMNNIGQPDDPAKSNDTNNLRVIETPPQAPVGSDVDTPIDNKDSVPNDTPSDP